MSQGTNPILKPIQYLGAKTRALDTILSECVRLYRQDTYVLDLFSGSSIVSQALYHSGMLVIANDVMRFCSDISACLLNVSRLNDSTKLLREAVVKLGSFELPSHYSEPFKDYSEQERLLLAKEDLSGLRDLYTRLPIVTNEKIPPAIQAQIIRDNIGKEAFNSIPLIANYYAGSYFGINQSIRLDTIRTFIEAYFKETRDYWCYTAMLTALYGTLSTIVHSAGKHFAQPIFITDLDKEKITNKRLFENRSYDVDKLFVEFIESIITKTSIHQIPSSCLSLCSNIQNVSFLSLFEDKSVSVMYADPPYTAQQYSRFYHIPEVIRFYKYPQLQYQRGHITQGLYPEDKFKSDFSSKSKSKKAFEDLFCLVKKKQSNLILSYSESKKKKTGNERMVTKDDLISIAKNIIPNYKVNEVPFDFEYRQLNSASNVVQDKEDKEFLIIFEKR